MLEIDPGLTAELTRQCAVVRCVVVDIVSGQTSHWGDQATARTLVRTLVGDLESARALDRSLIGQKLPRLWEQGDTSCVVCKPTSAILFLCVVHKEEDGVVGVYRRSLQIDTCVRAAYSG